MRDIHSTAIVHPGAELGEDVAIGPYAVVDQHVKLGRGTRVGPHAVVTGNTQMGEGNQVFPFAAIGTIPQDLKFRGEKSFLQIGDRNRFRECVTVNLGTEGGGLTTRIGSDNLLMAYTHVGHDCQIGNHCVLANYSGLAGHIVVEDFVILGGYTGIHQFVRVGSHAMTSGGAKVGKDVPPFTIAQGYPARLRGVNLVGLKRRGFKEEVVKALKKTYNLVLGSDLKVQAAIAQARETWGGIAEVEQLLRFVEASLGSERGFLRPARLDADDSADEID